MKILIIEDERSLSDILITLLEQNGYSADAVYDGITGLDYAESGIYDAIILDIMLPGQSGLVVLRKLRAAGASTPVLLFSAKSEVEDKIQGLDIGADDYLTKPFSTGELLARLRAITRRKGKIVAEELTFCDVTLSKDTHTLAYQGSCVKLSAKEYEMMEMLMKDPRRIIAKEAFIEKIWGFDSEAEYNTIEVYVSFLRKKIQAIDANIQIKVIRGAGYLLEGNDD